MTVTKKYWYRPLDASKSVEFLKANGNSKGASTGFNCFDEFMSLKSRSILFFYGTPFSGKSEFIFEILIYCILKYNWRIVLYSPESGTKEEILAEFISKLFYKPFYKNVQGCLTEDEMYRGLAMLQDHLIIVDPGYHDIAPDEFYKIVDEIENEVGKIHVSVIDPWNELKHDFGKANRQDLYLEEKLGMIRRNAQEKNRLNIVSTHVTDQAYIQDSETKIRFYPVPSAREIAGGQAWYRKGMNMVSVWRPPFGLKDAEGIPFTENEVHLTVQKYKPKGVGKRGTAIVYFDKDANRYYEMKDGAKHYPGR